MSALEKLKEEIRVEIGASDIFNVAVRQMAHAAACRAVDQCAAEIRTEVLREAIERGSTAADGLSPVGRNGALAVLGELRRMADEVTP